MKMIIAAASLCLLGVVSSASAQGIAVGPGGVRVDTGPRERVIERRERGWDGDRVERRERRWSRDERSCRTTVVRRVNRYGEMVTRRIRECG
jgi:hypothetical protein